MPITAGYGMVKGVPHINGKPAKKCNGKHDDGHACVFCHGIMAECYVPWKCPECGAHLSPSYICLNACHLSAASLRRFNSRLAEATREAKS